MEADKNYPIMITFPKIIYKFLNGKFPYMKIN